MKLAISIILVTMLFQSCQVYFKTSVSVDEAFRSPKTQLKKIVTNNGKVYKFRILEVNNGKIYGLRKCNGKGPRIELNLEEINNMWFQDISASEEATIGLVLGTFGGLIAVVFIRLAYISYSSSVWIFKIGLFAI